MTQATRETTLRNTSSAYENIINAMYDNEVATHVENTGGLDKFGHQNQTVYTISECGELWEQNITAREDGRWMTSGYKHCLSLHIA